MGLRGTGNAMSKDQPEPKRKRDRPVKYVMPEPHWRNAGTTGKGDPVHSTEETARMEVYEGLRGRYTGAGRMMYAKTLIPLCTLLLLIHISPAYAQGGTSSSAGPRFDVTATYTGVQIYSKKFDTSENMPLGVTATFNTRVRPYIGLAFQTSYNGKKYEEYEADGVELSNNVYGLLGGFSARISAFWFLLLGGVERQIISANAIGTRANVSERFTGFAFQYESGITFPHDTPVGMTLSLALRSSVYDTEAGGSIDIRYSVGVSARL